MNQVDKQRRDNEDFDSIETDFDIMDLEEQQKGALEKRDLHSAIGNVAEAGANARSVGEIMLGQTRPQFKSSLAADAGSDLERKQKLLDSYRKMKADSSLQLQRDESQRDWQKTLLDYQHQNAKELANQKYGQNRSLKELEIANKDKKPGIFEAEKLKQYGKAGVEWITKDRGNLVANTQKTGKAIELLQNAIKNKAPLSGPGRGLVPDAIRSFTNPDAVIAKDSIHSAIQDTLRPTLGAQFTEKEGERIKALAYNDRLSDEENMRRAQMLQEVIEKKVAATDALYAWIEENGTDRGFPYEQYDMRKIGGEMVAQQPAAPKGPQPGAVVDGYAFKGGDPNDPNAWAPVEGIAR